MATLIAVYNSEGCVGRCDARCYNATAPHCACICGGRNHGVGLDQAVGHVRRYAAAMFELFKAEHPGDYDLDVFPKPIQLELF